MPRTFSVTCPPRQSVFAYSMDYAVPGSDHSSCRAQARSAAPLTLQVSAAYPMRIGSITRPAAGVHYLLSDRADSRRGFSPTHVKCDAHVCRQVPTFAAEGRRPGLSAPRADGIRQPEDPPPVLQLHTWIQKGGDERCVDIRTPPKVPLNSTNSGFRSLCVAVQLQTNFFSILTPPGSARVQLHHLHPTR